MRAPSRSAVLGIYLKARTGGDLKVGTLVRTGRETVFIPDEAYIAMGSKRPILSLAWKGASDDISVDRLRSTTDKVMRGTQLPAFFDNLLPEGALRELIKREFGTGNFDNFDVLARLGADLPGAVVARLEAGDVARPASVRHGSMTAELAETTIRFSLAGVQLKFSMTLDRQTLTVPARHDTGEVILKTPSKKIAHLPEVELSALTLARAAGVDTVDAQLVQNVDIQGIPDEFLAGGPSLAVARYDRRIDGSRIHVEDFAQILGALGDQKYAMANDTVLMNMAHRFCDDAIGSLLEAARRVTVNILIGNGDAHLKNWSFAYAHDGTIRLTPAYDIVPTFLYGEDEMALEFGGTRNPALMGIHKFERAAGLLKVKPRIVIDEVERTVRKALEEWPALIRELPLPIEAGQAILERLPRLQLVQEIAPEFDHERGRSLVTGASP